MAFFLGGMTRYQAPFAGMGFLATNFFSMGISPNSGQLSYKTLRNQTWYFVQRILYIGARADAAEQTTNGENRRLYGMRRRA